MNCFKTSRPTVGAMILSVSMLSSCSHDHDHGHGEPREGVSKEPGTTITNRITLPPGAVNNLGITFASVTRGKVGSWLSVPGELYVPDTHRWKLRAPAGGRIVSVIAKWEKVTAGEVIAEILSPELRHAQQGLVEAMSRSEIARENAQRAAAREHQGTIQRKFVLELQSASFKRFNDLKKLNENTNSFGAREVLAAQREFTEATQAAMDSSIKSDKLRENVFEKDLLSKQAQLKIDESIETLALLSGRTLEELMEVKDGNEVWKTIGSIEIRAPAPGTIVDVFATQGENLDKNQPLALILDPGELRFRGWIPEGDLPRLKNDAPVRVALPGGIPPVSTTLLGPRPIADSATRRVQVEAQLPNPGQELPQGLSATAQVLVKESAGEEVLVPLSCIVSDGLEKIVFRRDPEKANVVIRTPVELGLSGGGFVEVIAGLLANDTVVDQGKHQLKQTGKGKAPKGGHFHADGTWHLKDE